MCKYVRGCVGAWVYACVRGCFLFVLRACAWTWTISADLCAGALVGAVFVCVCLEAPTFLHPHTCNRCACLCSGMGTHTHLCVTASAGHSSNQPAQMRAH